MPNNMTWCDLLIELQGMSEEKLYQNVTVYASGLDEFFPVKSKLGISKEKDAADGILDHGHFYLETAEPGEKVDSGRDLLTQLQAMNVADGILDETAEPGIQGDV